MAPCLSSMFKSGVHFRFVVHSCPTQRQQVEIYTYLLQEAGGPSLTPPPYPNAAYPSPYKYMDDGCIHCSAEGWDILMGRLYEGWLVGRI